MEADAEQHWHIEKGVPISLIITIISWAVIQTSTAAWFASSIDKRVEALESAQRASAPQGERLTRLEEKVVAVQAGISDIKTILQQVSVRPREMDTH